jgi:hypothetical protein
LISHPLYYYFRRVRPWTRAPSPDPALIGRSLGDPGQWKPMLVSEATYQDFMNAHATRPPSPPMVALPDVVLLLPGPYSTCADEVHGGSGLAGPPSARSLALQRTAGLAGSHGPR